MVAVTLREHCGRRSCWRDNFWRQGIVALAIAGLAVPVSAAAESPLGTLAEVARILDYPAGKLVAKDLTEYFRIKYGDDIVSAHEYSSRDNTFVPITVTVARQGILLTPELRVRLKKALAAGPAAEGRGLRNLKVIRLDNGIEGFAGVDGFGGGPERWHFVLAVPPRRIDVHLSAPAASSETFLDVEPATARYYQRARAGGEMWWEQLTNAGRQGISGILRETPTEERRIMASIQPRAAPQEGEGHWLRTSVLTSLQSLHATVEGGSSRWLLMGTVALLIIGVLAARIGIYGK